MNATIWEKFKAILSIAYGALVELLDADTKLLVLIALLVLLDLVTGVRASLRRGRPITARRMRATAAKVLEYTVLLVAFTALSTGFAFLGWIREAAFCYVALTEAKSIVENLYGPGTKVFERITEFRRFVAGHGDSELRDVTDSGSTASKQTTGDE